MEYLLLIYADEKAWSTLSKDEVGQIMAAYGTYTQELIAAGVMRGGSELAPTPTATTVRVRNGKTLTTDGPFAETKEQLGGYYLIDVPNLDEAIKWAAKIPSAASGSVEIRPQVDNS
ncbi:MAG: YciI family protein [Betaproteobacteria bacterium]|nr:YciI family protein [Betaproteobacteria bacterium]